MTIEFGLTQNPELHWGQGLFHTTVLECRVLTNSFTHHYEKILGVLNKFVDTFVAGPRYLVLGTGNKVPASGTFILRKIWSW